MNGNERNMNQSQVRLQALNEHLALTSPAICLVIWAMFV